MLAGKEKMERFRCVEDRRGEGYVKIELESVAEGGPGTVDLVPPFEIHSEKGALERWSGHRGPHDGCGRAR